MSKEGNNFTLRYYKHQRKFQRLKAQKKLAESIKISESRLFAELEGQVNQLQEASLTFGNGCECKVCTHSNPAPNLRQDHYLTNVQAYSSFFTLLQHLTMIEAYEAPKMLGQLFIPMLFFKKQSHKKQKKIVRGSQNKTIPNQPPSFIVFKSNIQNGQLEYPQTIKSLEKVEKKIRTREQTIRKMKTEQQKHILNLHYVPYQNQDQFTNIVHKKFFNREIPSLALSSNKLIVKKPSIKQFIIHQEDKYIGEEEDSHKIKQSEPFCIFRYTSKSDGEQVSKYQIFTLQTMQMLGKNKKMLGNPHQKQGQKLQLMYIESYTRIKPQIFRHNLKQHKENESYVQVTYFSEYSDSDKSIQECSIYSLCRLQISIRSGKLAKIDPLYLDKYSLEQKISTMLSLNDKISTQKIQKLVNYKTYKIINILDQVCRIKAKSLKLKWMLNDHDQIVLLQCLEYVVDRDKSLQPSKSKDEHAAHIVDFGLEYLHENMIIQDLGSMFRNHDNVNQIIQSKIQERKKQKAKTQGTQLERNHQMLKDMSQSMSLGKNQNKNKRLEPLTKKYNSIDLRKSVPNSLITYANEYNLIPMLGQRKMLDSKDKLKSKKIYGSPARKSYKLRPLKTDHSPHRNQ